jgi:hypothetical protein
MWEVERKHRRELARKKKARETYLGGKRICGGQKYRAVLLPDA